MKWSIVRQCLDTCRRDLLILVAGRYLDLGILGDSWEIRAKVINGSRFSVLWLKPVWRAVSIRSIPARGRFPDKGSRIWSLIYWRRGNCVLGVRIGLHLVD